MRTRKVFIIESHPVLRDSYAFLLGRQDDLDVCGVNGSVASAEAALGETPPDLILVNFIPGDDGRGLNGIRTLSAAHPDACIVVVSSHAPDVHAEDARDAGASLFMHRDRVPFELLTCVREVLATHERNERPGESSLKDDAPSKAPARTSTPRLRLPLDEREREVFRFLGMGMTLPQVAARLNVDAAEVRRQRSRIMDTLHLASPHDLALFAREWVANDTHEPMTRSQPRAV